jgi:WD40 repeat protein
MGKHRDAVLAIAVAPDDSIMFTGSKDETIMACSTKKTEPVFTLRAHNNTVFRIDAHPTERLIVSCGADGLVCVWEYRSV